MSGSSTGDKDPAYDIDPLGRVPWWQFWNWNAPSLPLSQINNINSSHSGTYIDPSLTDRNTFDRTLLGEFSLNNFILMNGITNGYQNQASQSTNIDQNLNIPVSKGLYMPTKTIHVWWDQ